MDHPNSYPQTTDPNDGQNQPRPWTGILQRHDKKSREDKYGNEPKTENPISKTREVFEEKPIGTDRIAELILACVITSVTIGQLVSTYQISKGNSAQTDQIIAASKYGAYASKQNANAASDFSSSARSINQGIDSAVGRLGAQAFASQQAADAATSAAKTAQTSLEVQNRPWVSAEVTANDSPMGNGDLQFDRDGNLTVTLMIRGKNFGKSIAQDIRIYTKLFALRLGEPFEETPKRQRELCDQPDIHYVRPGIPFFQGFDRFPDQPYEQVITDTLPKEEVIRESSFYSDDPLRHRYIDRLYLVGCVDYRFSFRTDRHQTRFAYDLIRNPDPTIKAYDGIPLMEFEVGANISKDMYVIIPSLHGGNSAY